MQTQKLALETGAALRFKIDGAKQFIHSQLGWQKQHQNSKISIAQSGTALGFQIDGAKQLIQLQLSRQNQHQTLLFKIMCPKSMVQLHPLRHPNAVPTVLKIFLNFSSISNALLKTKQLQINLCNFLLNFGPSLSTVILD